MYTESIDCQGALRTTQETSYIHHNVDLHQNHWGPAKLDYWLVTTGLQYISEVEADVCTDLSHMLTYRSYGPNLKKSAHSHTWVTTVCRMYLCH